MVTKISHITLFVRDQQKAHDVYVGKLGFKVNTDMKMENGMRWLTVNPPGQADVEVILTEPKAPMIAQNLVGHYEALLEAEAMGAGVWECDNCQKTYEELSAKGIEFSKKPTKEFYGIEALFKDGCGNWFSLTERPKRG
jgi:catechol 2,3-dioxygenase-like lactoylglutathione lyase family enzyme